MGEWVTPFVLLVVILTVAFLVDTFLLEPRRRRRAWRDWFDSRGIRVVHRKRRDKDE